MKPDQAFWRAFCAQAGAQLDDPLVESSIKPVGGGSINDSYCIEGGARNYFVKTNKATRLEMFEMEATGLNALADTNALRVPKPHNSGLIGNTAYLILEWIEFRRPDAGAERRLGEGLARQHDVIGPRYGWHRDNTLGTTSQPNQWHHDWVDFLREERLRHQLMLADQAGFSGALQEKGALLVDGLRHFFRGCTLRASLLHGDLWGGNWGADDGGQPVVFDPAVYYGDAECDIAMTELFGGFGPDFYAAYRQHLPDEPGGETRRRIYRLYHVLNHLNMFGGGYRDQAQDLLDGLIAELG